MKLKHILCLDEHVRSKTRSEHVRSETRSLCHAQRLLNPHLNTSKRLFIWNLVKWNHNLYFYPNRVSALELNLLAKYSWILRSSILKWIRNRDVQRQKTRWRDPNILCEHPIGNSFVQSSWKFVRISVSSSLAPLKPGKNCTFQAKVFKQSSRIYVRMFLSNRSGI